MSASIFVGRELPLVQLQGFLNRALAGQGQICFVTGEAGSGKTALVTEFARRALERNGELVAAIGQCDAHTGAGDAYLPFREILGQLTGDVEGKPAQGIVSQENAGRLRKLLRLSGQALAEVGPDLIGIFVPGAGLLARAAAFAAEKAGWLDRLEKLAGREAGPVSGIQQEHIFEQYTNVLRHLAEKQPLLLLLDDLQWADVGSLDLLFRLGRRIADCPVLVVGTYRPADVALGRARERHPLEKVLAELKRYLGEIEVDLAQVQEDEGRAFVDAFLDSEPNRLREDFRQALYSRTGGHPLFTVELLRAMQERGDLVQDGQGHWIPRLTLDWDTFPARVEGVIEERIGRLEEELREALTVGSVEGETFTAEVIARVQDRDARQLVHRLSQELTKQHRLVRGQGVQRLDGQRLSLYRFQHNLFQKYLYQNLDEVERAYLHEDVGRVLEELYGERAAEIAVQLAYHFREAELLEKARDYLRQAGEQAADRYAHVEALAHLGQALEFVPEEEAGERYTLLLIREQVYSLQGNRQAQGQDLSDLHALAEELDDDHKRIEVAVRQAQLAEVTADYPTVVANARKVIQLAEGLPDRHSQAAGYRAWGIGLARQGDFEAGRAQLERALQVSREIGDRRNEGTTLNNIGFVFYCQGNYAAARTYYEQALEIARELENRPEESKLLNNLGIVCSSLGDYRGAESYYEQALQLFRQLGFRQGEGVALGNLGNISAMQGNHAAARGFFEQARLICHEIGDLEGEGRNLGNLGILSAERGEYDTARAHLEKALAIHRQIGSAMVEGHTLGNLGNVCREQGDYIAARSYHEKALQIARQIGDRWSESNQLDNLGRDLADQGEYTQALAHCSESLSISRDIGNPHGERTSFNFLGIIYDDLGAYVEAATQLEAAQRIAQEAGDQRGRGYVGSSQGLLLHHMGKDEAAQEHLRQALRASKQVGDCPSQAAALTYLGHALARLGDVAEAAAAYQQALDLRRALGQPHLAMEVRAGLARVALDQGNLAQAWSHIEEILAFLQQSSLAGTAEPLRIYLTCYNVLQARADPRAPEVLHTAYQQLQTVAEKIVDPDLRRSFLVNVEAHQTIIRLWEAPPTSDRVQGQGQSLSG